MDSLFEPIMGYESEPASPTATISSVSSWEFSLSPPRRTPEWSPKLSRDFSLDESTNDHRAKIARLEEELKAVTKFHEEHVRGFEQVMQMNEENLQEMEVQQVQGNQKIQSQLIQLEALVCKLEKVIHSAMSKNIVVQLPSVSTNEEDLRRRLRHLNAKNHEIYQNMEHSKKINRELTNALKISRTQHAEDTEIYERNSTELQKQLEGCKMEIKELQEVRKAEFQKLQARLKECETREQKLQEQLEKAGITVSHSTSQP